MGFYNLNGVIYTEIKLLIKKTQNYYVNTDEGIKLIMVLIFL